MVRIFLYLSLNNRDKLSKNFMHMISSSHNISVPTRFGEKMKGWNDL